MLKAIHKIFNFSRIPNISPEFFHNLSMKISEKAENNNWIINKITNSCKVKGEEKLKFNIEKVEFKNPIGLAAGFCKEPVGLKFWEAFGFGSITIGGITRDNQKGNSKKRIFRFSDGIVNGMGLPGPGLDRVVEILEERVKNNMMPSIPLGANLCNSLETKPEEKIEEFKEEMEKLYPYMSYFEINISCPNQAGVCSLQSEVGNILEELTKYNLELSKDLGIPRKLLFVKISPLTQNENKPEDGTIDGLKSLANIFNEYKGKGLDGIIATNTAKEHNHKNITKINTPNGGKITGGASGLQIQETSKKTVKKLREFLDKEIPIIGVGGIGYDKKGFEGQSGVKMINSGAISLQILSSFVQYGTLEVVKDLKKAILKIK